MSAIEVPRMGRRKVLVVDDSEVILQAVRTCLEDAGFDVVTLSSPFGFSASLTAEKPDLVLLDVSMPALDGARLLQIARRYSSAPAGLASTRRGRCPVVLYSDRPENELRTLAASCGADGYVRKSSDFSPVLQMMRRLLGLR